MLAPAGVAVIQYTPSPIVAPDEARRVQVFSVAPSGPVIVWSVRSVPAIGADHNSVASGTGFRKKSYTRATTTRVSSGAGLILSSEAWNSTIDAARGLLVARNVTAR